ncbi:hypothetical protein ACIRYZ_44220 [Kitasatospora sp. NPDC101155]|uniref:hypothetical protein n=1 Tax=Kitasatospora sp. NPDC101155 TaxID=3364097 RepID=UPI0038305BF1
MNTDSLDPNWIRDWAAAVTAHLQSVLAAFDTYYPFPPGENEVVLAAPDQLDSLDALRAQPATPPDLVTFYKVINEVAMPDIGNAFFIHAADATISQLSDGPALLNDGDAGTIFASNGGGILYAIGRDSRVHRSHAASPDSDFEPIATNLRDFLEQLRDAVAHFAATGTPGDL